MDRRSSPFTEFQLRLLNNLGVTADQIRELETVAVPTGRAWLGGPQPTFTDVRSELQALSDAMRLARNAMSRLLEEGVQTPAQREAADRALEVIYKMGGNGETIKKALDAVTLMHGALEKATREMPQGERYNRTASMIPVSAIHRALVSGFVTHRSTIHVIEEHVKEDPKKNPNPWAYRIKVSSFPGSKFRQIADVCYQAMGRKRGASERAIRAYIAHRKAQLGSLKSDLLAEAEADAMSDPEERSATDKAMDWLRTGWPMGERRQRPFRRRPGKSGSALRSFAGLAKS